MITTIMERFTTALTPSTAVLESMNAKISAAMPFMKTPEFRWARSALIRWSERGASPVRPGSAARAAATQPAH